MPEPRTLSPAEVAAFVDNVDLPGRDPAMIGLERTEELPQPDFSKEEADSLTVGSQIASFADGFPPHLRQPIATGSCWPNLPPTRCWNQGGGTRERYRDLCRDPRAHWPRSTRTPRSPSENSGSAVEVHKAIIPVITTLLGGPAVAAAAAIVSVLEGLAEMNPGSPSSTEPVSAHTQTSSSSAMPK